MASIISHGMGLLLALAGTPFLIMAAVQKDNALSVLSVSSFATTLGTST